MSSKTPVVAIVGRTNVGKSTLFNALAKRRFAVIEDTGGVTRDRNYVLIQHYGAAFSLIDTGGLVGEEDALLRDAVRRQTELAIEESDLVVAVLDGIDGPHPLDTEVVELLRRTVVTPKPPEGAVVTPKPTACPAEAYSRRGEGARRKVLWVVNKCERPVTEITAAEFYTLGIDELHFVSAAHRLGIRQLAQAIIGALGIAPVQVEDTSHIEPIEDEQIEDIREKDAPIHVAVLGRPNVGKSTLVNKILGEERIITSPIPGTTRDSIDVPLTREGQKFVIIDTAGLRKKSRVQDGTIERFSNLRTLRSLARGDVAVLVLDATEGAPGEQDKKLAALIHERGTGLVIVVNKWDLVEKDHRTVKMYKDIMQRELGYAYYAPIIFTSALSGRRCPHVLSAARRVYETSRLRIKTAELNKVFSHAFEVKPPPVYRGGPVKLFFATQIGVAPPRIVLFVNYPQGLKPSYLRYLTAQLRKHHPFEGCDVKLELRKRTDKEQRASGSAAHS